MKRLKTRVSYTLKTTTLVEAMALLGNAEVNGITHVRMVLMEKYEPAPRVRPPKINPKISKQPAQPGRVHLHGTEGTVREFAR